MENFLNVTLTSSGAEPAEPLCGGTRGEHRATALLFTLDAQLAEAITEAEAEQGAVSVKLDVITEAGEFVPGEERKISDLTAPFYLTAAMTASGLDAVVLVRFLVKDSKGALIRELYKAQIRLWFEDSFGGITLPRIKKPSEAEAKVEELCRLIEQRTAEAEKLITVKAEQVSAQVKSSAEQFKKTLAASERAESAAASSEGFAAECNRISKQISEGISQTSQAVAEAKASANEVKELCERCENNLAELTLYTDRVAERLGESANSFKGKASGKELHLSDVSPLAHKVKLWVETNLLKGTKAEDTEFGYAKSVVFSLERNKSYRYEIITADGTGCDVVITGDGWEANSSPAYYFAETSGEFVHGYSSGVYAIYCVTAAENILSLELSEVGAVSSQAVITVTDVNGAVTETVTDSEGRATVESACPEMRIACRQNAVITAEYNRDTAAVIGELEAAIKGLLNAQQSPAGGGVNV